jgi:nucleoside-diphosphate-sugar epimerase
VSETVLVTGADGYVGRLVTRRLVADTDAGLVLTVRASDSAGLAAKRHALAGTLGPVSPHRVQVVAADLRSAEPFTAVNPAPITRILHTAAVTRFSVEQTVARAVNVEGTGKVVAFAHRCARLRRLVALSTVYSAGRRTGPIAELPHDDAGFVNFYEWSKWKAERRLLDAAAEMPLAIARLGTLIAHDDSGAVEQHNAFHNTFRLVYHGLLSVIPGHADTPVYLLTGSLAAAATTHLLLAGAASGIYHVCPERPHTPTLGALLDDVLAVFEDSPAYRARRLLRPLLCDREAFEGLAAAVRSLGASPLRQAVASVSPFAEQLYLGKDVRNPRLRAAFPRYATPDPAELVRATATSLVATRWGRTSRKATRS